MGSLQDLRADCLYRLEEIKANYRDPADPDFQVHAWRLYCEALGNLAYVSLLADADPKQCSLFLTRSGANWFVLLGRARASGFVVPAYRNQPLLGVMATDNVSFAADIARLSSGTQHVDEYADEFLYALLLQEIIASLDGHVIDKQALLRTVQALRKEANDARPEVCQALLAGDAPSFWPALEELGRGYVKHMEELKKSPAGPYLTWRAGQFVWLEGLALLRIAARLGLGAPPGHLPCLPPLAFSISPAVDDGLFLLARS